MAEEFDAGSLEDLLPSYYRRLFPAKLLYKWLSYGDRKYFLRREWSFILKDDVYLRYKSFTDIAELERQIRTDLPFKIDLGAVYSHPPKNHKSVINFEAQERELVFDIDLTDYDDVRTCCSGGSMCGKCWMFMVVAVKILNSALRDDFGYNHLLWVYSGRRGVHCWVCDKEARLLSSQARTAVAEYLSVVVGGEFNKKKVQLPDPDKPLHPHIQRSLEVIDQHLGRFLQTQDWMKSEEEWKKICDVLTSDEAVLHHLEEQYSKIAQSSPKYIWEELSQFARNNVLVERFRNAVPELPNRPMEELKLQMMYPRLDANVTKGINHLLKSPFCVHPKTGKISVPFCADTVDKFDYERVPRIDTVLNELRQQDAENAASTASDDPAGMKRKTLDYKRTSLLESVSAFENFLAGLEPERGTGDNAADDE